MNRKSDPFVRASKALSQFEKAVKELRVAADEHLAIADEARIQIDELTDHHVRNRSAAVAAQRRADKISEFLA